MHDHRTRSAHLLFLTQVLAEVQIQEILVLNNIVPPKLLVSLEMLMQSMAV